MTKYREILRLSDLGISQANIAYSCSVSKKTVNKVLKAAKEKGISWPLDESQTDAVLAKQLFPEVNHTSTSTKRMPDYAYIRKELLRNGVSKKLLWTEYMEDCRQSGEEPLMYSQFCYYIQQDENKPNAEGSVGNISTWIVAALRNEQFFTIAELNAGIRKKLDEFNHRPFQKKEGSRYELFHGEELPLLTPLPATRYELAEWKQATVQFNYHISVDGMLYSIPYEYIHKKVDVRITGTIIEVFYKQNRIASHRRLYGRKGQYSTETPRNNTNGITRGADYYRRK